MKVLLIYPGVSRTPDSEERKFQEVPNYHLPLGILYLGQVLKDAGHEIVLFDHYVSNLSIDMVIEWIKKVDPEVIGFTVISATLPTANVFTKKVKEWNPNVKIIYGGYLATFCDREILEKCDDVDIIVRGEGELTIVELLEALEKGTEMENVRGISYRDKGRIKINTDRPLISNLDHLPIPDRKLFHQSYQFHGKITTLVSTRGCPYHCRFCSCWTFSRGKWRVRSIRNILEELCYLQDEGFREILFTDDCFNANRKRTIQLCHLMKKEGISLDWHANGRIDNSDTHLLRTMVQAGCKTLVYGIESATQRILDYYNKRITPQMAYEAIKHSKKAGIEYIGGGFIIGAPIETRAEIIKTVKFGLALQKVGLTAIQFQTLFLSPGTSLYQEYLEQGYINLETQWGQELPAVDVVPSMVKRTYLEHIAKIGFKEFITNKRALISEYLKSARSLYRLRGFYFLLQQRNKTHLH
ncbi:MAG: B12-binding domain-containing radical SAM protein [Candidatus Helarchaeota archaeon]